MKNNTNAQQIALDYLETIKGNHYAMEDIFNQLLADENYLPDNVVIYVGYNNLRWNTLITIENAGNITTFTPEEARIFAAWLVERYSKICGMPEISTYADSTDVYDLLSGRYEKLHAVDDNIRLRDHWGYKGVGGIHVELYAPKTEQTDECNYLEDFFARRFLMVV